MSRRCWCMPGETLGNKAFRFGIFWSRIGSVKTLPLHCFCNGNLPNSDREDCFAEALPRPCRCCPAGKALLRLQDDASLGKCFRIMLPILGISPFLPRPL